MSLLAIGNSVQIATLTPSPIRPLQSSLPLDELRAVASTANTWTEWLEHVSRLTVDAIPATGVFTWEPVIGTQPERLTGFTFPADGLADAVRQRMRAIAEEARSTGRFMIVPLGSTTGEQLAAITLARTEVRDTVLVVLVPRQTERLTAIAAWLPLVAAYTELWSITRGACGLAASNSSAHDRPPESLRERHDLGTVCREIGLWLGSQWQHRRARWIVAATAMTSVALTINVPYDVSCDCELQPVTRRFVAAPFEGVLEKALVEVGDTVSAGQLMARMDGREVRWELAGNVAEYERAAKERDARLAEQDFGETQLAKLQMERLSLTTKLLEDRNEHLEIRSPIDGIVVSGDLKRAEGIRLSMGQNLFEVAPLDRMIVEVAIPESEVAYLAPHAETTIRLEAFPSQPVTGSLNRICPRAELRNQQQVFVGEIALPNESGGLRPGMRGRAKLKAGHAPLGWRLFHRAWDKLRLWWGA